MRKTKCWLSGINVNESPAFLLSILLKCRQKKSQLALTLSQEIVHQKISINERIEVRHNSEYSIGRPLLVAS